MLNGHLPPTLPPKGGSSSISQRARLPLSRFDRASFSFAAGRRDVSKCCTLELQFPEVGLPRETSCLVAGVDQLSVDLDVELSGLAGLDVDMPVSICFDPGLHTEGFGSIASGRAVMNDDRHCPSLPGGTRAPSQTRSLPAEHGNVCTVNASPPAWRWPAG